MSRQEQARPFMARPPASTVGWAFRGFNPHHRKEPSYYPLLAHVAQTGHILRLKNRPGNVHDSKQATAFLRAMIVTVRERLGPALPLEFRRRRSYTARTSTIHGAVRCSDGGRRRGARSNRRSAAISGAGSTNAIRRPGLPGPREHLAARDDADVRRTGVDRGL